MWRKLVHRRRGGLMNNTERYIIDRDGENVTVIEAFTEQEVVGYVKEVYHQGDIVLGELLACLTLDGFTMEETENIIKKLRQDIDGIELYKEDS
jgi:hypothetical protein